MLLRPHTWCRVPTRQNLKVGSEVSIVRQNCSSGSLTLYTLPNADDSDELHQPPEKLRRKGKRGAVVSWGASSFPSACTSLTGTGRRGLTLKRCLVPARIWTDILRLPPVMSTLWLSSWQSCGGAYQWAFLRAAGPSSASRSPPSNCCFGCQQDCTLLCLLRQHILISVLDAPRACPHLFLRTRGRPWLFRAHQLSARRLSPLFCVSRVGQQERVSALWPHHCQAAC